MEEARQAESETSSGEPTIPSSVAGPRFTGPPPDSFTGYKIIRELHRAGQGVVYQAIQKSTQRKVPIKVMREGPFDEKDQASIFARDEGKCQIRREEPFHWNRAVCMSTIAA